MIILEPKSLGGRPSFSSPPVPFQAGQGKLPRLPVLVQLESDRVEVDDVDVEEVAEEVLVERDVELSVVLFPEETTSRPSWYLLPQLALVAPVSVPFRSVKEILLAYNIHLHPHP